MRRISWMWPWHATVAASPRTRSSSPHAALTSAGFSRLVLSSTFFFLLSFTIDFSFPSKCIGASKSASEKWNCSRVLEGEIFHPLANFNVQLFNYRANVRVPWKFPNWHEVKSIERLSREKFVAGSPCTGIGTKRSFRNFARIIFYYILASICVIVTRGIIRDTYPGTGLSRFWSWPIVKTTFSIPRAWAFWRKLYGY